MNIFYLDEDITTCAKYHCNKHVIKMILEYSQLLSTVHRVLDGNESDLLYKATHISHPCCKWVGANNSNYNYLYNLFTKVAEEYTYRYSKIHTSYTRLKDILKKPPKNIPKGEFSPPPLVMPDEFKTSDVVESYRIYYKSKQYKFELLYKNRETPYWL